MADIFDSLFDGTGEDFEVPLGEDVEDEFFDWEEDPEEYEFYDIFTLAPPEPRIPLKIQNWGPFRIRPELVQHRETHRYNTVYIQKFYSDGTIYWRIYTRANSPVEYDEGIHVDGVKYEA